MLVSAVTSPASGQSSVPRSEPAAAPENAAEVGPAAPEQSTVAADQSGTASPDPDTESESNEGARFPLLREGSYLLRAPSTLHFEPKSGTWIVTLRDDLETERDREVTALPCEALEDMISHIRGRTEVQWFEVTALVLTYRNRNFLLPMVAIPLSGEPERQSRAAMLPPGAIVRGPAMVPGPNQLNPLMPGAAVVRPRGTPPGYAAPIANAGPVGPRPSAVVREAPPVAAVDTATKTPPGAVDTAVTTPPASIDPEQFAADVERALEERIRVVPRSSDIGPAPSPFVRDRSVRGLSEGAAPITLPTSARIQDRRGVVTRDPVSGTWRFVFHGERHDLGERGIELLPSAVLERMERFVRQTETPPVLLVSGQLTRFEGRNFLLPSSFRTIASGRWIFP